MKSQYKKNPCNFCRLLAVTLNISGSSFWQRLAQC